MHYQPALLNTTLWLISSYVSTRYIPTEPGSGNVHRLSLMSEWNFTWLSHIISLETFDPFFVLLFLLLSRQQIILYAFPWFFDRESWAMIEVTRLKVYKLFRHAGSQWHPSSLVKLTLVEFHTYFVFSFKKVTDDFYFSFQIWWNERGRCGSKLAYQIFIDIDRTPIQWQEFVFAREPEKSWLSSNKKYIIELE